MIQSSRQRKEKGERNLQRFSKINISNFKRRIQVSKSKIYIYIYIYIIYLKKIKKKKKKKKREKREILHKQKERKTFPRIKLIVLVKQKGKENSTSPNN